MFEFLSELHSDDQAAMMGYQLKNTVSRHGSVTRGICHVESGKLTGVREVQKIELDPDGTICNRTDPNATEILQPNELVSMNFWGFSEGIFEPMQAAFEAFLRSLAPDELKAEYLLPVMVDELIRSGRLSVHVLETSALWFGVTYREDRAIVANELRRLHEAGVYA
jgi:hypothetical protein